MPADLTIEDELALIQGKKAQPPATPAPTDAPNPAPAATVEGAPVEAAAGVEPALDTPAPVDAPPAAAPAPAAPDPEDGLPPALTDLEGPPTEAGTWEVMSAAWKKATIQADAWGYEHRQRNAIAQDMFDLLTPEGQQQVALSLRGRTSEDDYWKAVLAAAEKDKAADPAGASKWGQFPTTAEAIDAKINEDIAADRDEALRVLAQHGGGVAEFIGKSARMMTTPSNVIATVAGAFTGGAGTAAWRIIASEAALNAGVEGVDAYTEQQVARENGWQEPDIGQRMLLGAVFGAGLSGAILGGAKMFSMAQARRASTQAAVPEGADPLAAEAAIDKAEAALRDEPTPQELASPTLATALAGSADLPYNEAAVLRSIIGVESGGNAAAKNPNSTALGLGQFIGSTWLSMVKKHRPDIAAGKTDSEILNLRRDAGLSAEMTARYTRENAARLQANGIPADPGSLYLAHFMGPGGAVKAMKVPLDTPISRLMSPKEIAANRGIRFGGKSFADFTAGDLRRWSAHKMRAAYDPNASTDMPVFDTTSRGYTGAGQMKVGDDMTIDVEYVVVDASTLTTASGDFQPRDRSLANSDAWIADTASRLDPAQLMRSPTADRGAPLVGPDMMIESGNGRFGAIMRAYERHPDRAAAYRAEIEKTGIPIPEGVERPVLVAQRRTQLDNAQRTKLTIAAQDSGVAVLRPVEMAKVAARDLTPGLLAKADFRLDVADPANEDFLRGFMELMPRSRRNAMADPTGNLNGFGRRHLREALFARAWDDTDIIELMTEGQRGDLKGLFDALENSAPAWANLKADIETGAVAPDMDISGFVLDAMRMIATARKIAAREKTPLAAAMNDLLNSPDMIEGAVAPLTVGLLRKFWRNGRAAPEDEITSFLTRYADDARKAGATGGLFDTPSPRDVLVAIDKDTFGDLPQNLGAVRGPTRQAEAPRVEAVAMHHDAGTDAPEVEAADQALREVMDAAPAEPFGPAYDGFENDPAGAIAHLLQAKTGEVTNAFANADARLANVALVYGTDTMGLRHIELKHPDMLARLPEVMAKGRVEADTQGLSRMYVVLDGDPTEFVTIRLDWDGAEKHWIVTAAEDYRGKFARQSQTSDEPTASASSRVPDATGQSQDNLFGPADQAADIDPELDTIQAEIAAARADLGDDFASLSFDIDGVGKTRLSEFLDSIDTDAFDAAVLRACGINPGGAS